MKRIECTSCSFVVLLYDNLFYSTSIIWGTKFDYIILSFKVNNESTRMKYITVKRIVKSHNGYRRKRNITKHRLIVFLLPYIIILNVLFLYYFTNFQMR